MVARDAKWNHRSSHRRHPDAAQKDFITKQTAVAPAATPDCPLWDQFLLDATANDAGLIRFLRQWCGYTLTGDTREHALLFIFGQGGNGKSVFLNTVGRILAEYGKVAAMETFVASQSDNTRPTWLCSKGARMVSASETEDGRAWAETASNSSPAVIPSQPVS